MSGELSTGRHLVEFHWARGQLYFWLGRMLATGLTQTEFDCARLQISMASVRLGRAASWYAFANRLAATSMADLEAAQRRAMRLTPCCPGWRAGSRLRSALNRVAIEVSNNPLDEMAAMATLAQNTATALAGSDLTRAIELCDLQTRLLKAHAQKCLRLFAERLSASEVPLLLHIGEAIAMLIDHDLDMLAIAPAAAQGGDF
ncbi:MAG: hypothetical protein HYZ27_04665 [Deltaproteobacteria bacterium]|nr:hypothetical protein [Deltaproteobacteria bacterium]